jgi:hypothetical protein
MCLLDWDRYVQCGHRKLKSTDSSSCSYYNPELHCCSKNNNKYKEHGRLCPDCEAQLRQTSSYLHFKVRNLGDEYVDYDSYNSSSTISSQDSDDYNERYRKLQMEDTHDSMDLHAIAEEEERP